MDWSFDINWCVEGCLLTTTVLPDVCAIVECFKIFIGRFRRFQVVIFSPFYVFFFLLASLFSIFAFCNMKFQGDNVRALRILQILPSWVYYSDFPIILLTIFVSVTKFIILLSQEKSWSVYKFGEHRDVCLFLDRK